MAHSNQQNNQIGPRRGDSSRHLFSARDLMSRLFDEGSWDPFFDPRPVASDAIRGTFYPKVDVEEDDENVTVKANIPGIDPEKVDVNVEEDVVSLSGVVEREETKEDKEKQYYHYEREYGEFRRDIPLPAKVNPEDAKAVTKNGVLSITLPKASQGMRKKVKVEKQD